MFHHEAKQILRKLLLLHPRSPVKCKKVFSRSTFSDNSVQVPSSWQRAVIVLTKVLCHSRRRRPQGQRTYQLTTPASLLKIPNIVTTLKSLYCLFFYHLDE